MLGHVANDDTLERPAPVDRGRREPHSFAPSRSGVSWSLPDIAGAGLLALCVFVVHDVGYLLTKPFWDDESWVAVSTRAPLGSLPWITSSTPLGWTLLLRLVPGAGGWLRVLPLAFTMAAVVAAWWFGRELPLPRFTPILTGLATLLTPAMLVRDDLKQYTAEACAAVVLLVLVARLETQWSRRRLAAIVLFTPAAMLFANVVVFVGAAAVGALAIEPLVRRAWQRLREVAIAGLAMLGLCAAVYAAVDLRNLSPLLTDYWKNFYVPTGRGAGAAWTFLHQRTTQLAPALGLRYALVEGAVIAIGIITLIRVRRYALAAMVPLTILLVIAASAAHKYPFGDVRTSTFWLVMLAVLMAVGVAGIIDLARRRAPPAGIAVALIAAVLVWVSATQPYMRAHLIGYPGPLHPSAADAHTDVSSQVRYLEAHRRPGDVVVVNPRAAWGFAYYDHKAKPSYRHDPAITWGFLPTYPTQPWIVQMTSIQPAAVPVALLQAMHRLNSGDGRIWIVRSHLWAGEINGWNRTLSGKDVTTIRVGPEPLLLYKPDR